MLALRNIHAALALGCLAILSNGALAQRGPVQVSGVVMDSLHGMPLRDAVVRLEPAGTEVVTSDAGAYLFRDVSPGRYRLRVLHFTLDSLGVALETPEFQVDTTPVTVPVAVPSAERLITTLCTPAQLLRGPRAVVGVVRDPDTEAPIPGARVTAVFDSPIAKVLNVAVDPSVREARTDSAGRFRICGVPQNVKGRLQAESREIASGEVELPEADLLVLRGVRLSRETTVQTSTQADGRAVRTLVGTAQLTGRVRERDNSPAVGARVTVIGTNSVAVTGPRGEFTLDSLPAGTHTLEVRKLGYAAVQRSVELRTTVPTFIEVSLVDAARILAPTVTVSQRESDLAKVGFTERQRMGGGYFYEGDRVNKFGTSFSQTLGEVPSLRVVRIGDLDYRWVVTDRRDPQGCVNFIVDGNRWRSMTPGDIDDYVLPKDVEALEIYNAATVPAEFASPERGKCATIVVWTNARIRPKTP